MKARTAVLMLCLLFLTGCDAILAQLPPAGVTPQPTLPPIDLLEGPTPTPTDYRGLCAYVWNTQPLPEESALVMQAFREKNLSGVEGEALAYGETCVDSGTNVLVSFSPQQTDFAFTITVNDSTDTRALGEWIVQILAVIDSFPPGTFPGTKPGQMQLFFQDNSQPVDLSFDQQQARDLIRQGVRGMRLFEALSQ